MQLTRIVKYLRLVLVFLLTLVCALQITALTSNADQIIQNVPYLRQVADTPDDFVGCWACGATSAVIVAAYHNRLEADSNFYVDCCGNHKSEYGKYVSRQYTVAGYTFDTVTKMPSLEQCSDPNAGSPSGADAYGAYGYIHYADGLAKAKYARGYFRKHGLFSRIIGIISSADEYRNPTIEDVKSEIDQNRPVWTSTTLWASGHIIVIVGYTSGGDFIVQERGTSLNNTITTPETELFNYLRTSPVLFKDVPPYSPSYSRPPVLI